MVAIALVNPGDPYTQNFDSLSNTAGSTTNNLVIPGWFLTETGGGARDNEQYAVDTGGSNTGDMFSYGAAGATDRALGALRSGTLLPVFGANFSNDTGATITSLLISYTGEQWRLGTAARTDKLDFQISFDATSLTTGTWTDIDQLDFITPNTVTTGAKDGNLAANRTAISFEIGGLTIPAGTQFWIRWVDSDASMADDGLAIDDFSLTASTAVVPQPGELSIADNSVVEGNSTTQIAFTVTRANGDDGAVGATWTVTFESGDTADAADLGATLTGTVDFADGETSKQILVDVVGDTDFEPDETFTITLSAPTGGATLTDAVAVGTITNDDAAPPVPGELSIADAGVAEGDAGPTQLAFTVSRANGDDGAVSATWTITFDGTANAADLTALHPLTGTVDFADGETSKQILVDVQGDTDVEGDETFTITLTDPSGGATLGDAVATGTITNDDALVPVPGELSIADASVAEGDSGTSIISFTVTRATGDDGAVGATWTATFGTADADDFDPAQVFTGSVDFADGETSKTIELEVQGDDFVEPDETFTVTLSAPTGGATLGDDTATGTITNDDTIVFFNEFHYDDAGADSGEGIEIAGLAGTDLSGWSIVLYNGSDNEVYDTNGTINLTGIIPDQDDGYGTLSFALPVNGLQNGPADGFALVDDSGVVIQFLSYEGTITAANGVAVGMTSTDVGVSEDGVADGFSLQLVGTGAVYGDFSWASAMANTFGAVNTGQDFLGSAATGLVSVAAASVLEGDAGTTDLVFIVRRAGGLGSEASVDYVIGLTGTADAADLGPGAVLSGTVTFAVGQSEAEVRVEIQGDTVGEPNETLRIDLSNPVGNIAIVVDAAIGTILNDDPVNAEIAEIQGASHTSPLVGQLVTTTGIVTAVDSNGFYIQDPTPDADDATSEGVFVFTSTVPTVAVGDAVTVQGTVAEFQAAPDALTVTEIVSPSVTIDSSGNPLPAATLIGTGGRTPPTEAYDDDGFATFDPANDGLDFWESMEGMRATIDAPLVVANSNSFGETWVVASGGAGATGLNARDGMTISEGDSNPERIQLDNDANLSPGYTPDHTQGDVLDDVTGIVNYAFSNYELLVTATPTTTTDVTLGLETSTLAGDATHLTVASYNVENLDPTDPQANFDAIAADIVTGMNSPDIIGLQEVQDADGSGNGSDLSGQATADKLIAAIVAAGGPTYQYVEIAPSSPNSNGGEPNGNIRQGFLYNPARVTYVPGSAELVPNAGTRAPLAADFTFNGETVTLINAHSTSRGGSDPLMGANQPPTNAGDASRLAQAEAIRDYIDTLYEGDPELNILTLGDFNSFYWEAPLEAIQAGGAQTNLYTLLPEEERYSYQFEGNVQPFDNILVSYNLGLSSEFDAVHRNAEQPDSAGRPTDHDQALARILISADDIITATSGNDVRDSGAGNDQFLLQDGGDDSASGGTGNDFFYYGGEWTSDDVTDGGEGADTLALLGDYQFTFEADDLTGIERLVLLSGDAIGAGATSHYDIEMVDENVAAGQIFTVNATGLQPTEGLIFNGLAETDGRFFIRSGNCDDILVGGEGNDSIFGNSGSDSIFGRGGDDFLVGGLGEDVLRGGFGADRFNYETAADSTVAEMDWITDFQQVDTIRLIQIDADGNAGNGDTAFTFIGDAAFGNVAGQLRAYESGGYWFVEGDVDGDGNADLMIQVSTVGNAPLTGADFVL